MVAHGVFFKDLEKFLPTPNQNVNITDEIDPIIAPCKTYLQIYTYIFV